MQIINRLLLKKFHETATRLIMTIHLHRDTDKIPDVLELLLLNKTLHNRNNNNMRFDKKGYGRTEIPTNKDERTRQIGKKQRQLRQTATVDARLETKSKTKMQRRPSFWTDIIRHKPNDPQRRGR